MAQTLYGYKDPNKGWTFNEVQEIHHTHEISVDTWPPGNPAAAITCPHTTIVEGPYPFCAQCRTKMKSIGWTVL